MKFFIIKDFSSKCGQIRSLMWILLDLLRKSLIRLFLLSFCNETRSDTIQPTKKKELLLCKRFAWLTIINPSHPAHSRKLY